MKKEDITDKLIRIDITEEMIERAREHFLRDKAIHGFNNSKSFVSDKHRFLGSLGEEVVSSYFNTPLDNNTDYDIVLNGYRVEIKSRGINVNWVNSNFMVQTFKLCENCDKYIFVIVHNSFDYGWIVGHISKEGFNAKCQRVQYKGALEYILPIAELEEV